MTEQEYIGVIYHQLFNYTLSKSELMRWKAGNKLTLQKDVKRITTKQIPSAQQQQNVTASQQKLVIAQQAAAVLQRVPFILFVGISGSLAMDNAKPESDIDFMVITKKNTLWISRLFALLLLPLHHTTLRKAGNREERDKICLNLWIDESSYALPGMPHTAYTAHEIAQVIPLVNKKKTYQQWLSINSWITGYWPNAIVIRPVHTKENRVNSFITLINLICFVMQRLYMSGKITREAVTLHTAYFHPFDWGETIMRKLHRKGITESVK